MSNSIVTRIRQGARKRVLFLPHAVAQMSRPDRMISTADVREVIAHGRLVEDYPDDPRGHSCLVLGYGSGKRPIHVVCAPREDYLVIITAYLPSDEEWEHNFMKRKNK